MSKKVIKLKWIITELSFFAPKVLIKEIKFSVFETLKKCPVSKMTCLIFPVLLRSYYTINFYDVFQVIF